MTHPPIFLVEPFYGGSHKHWVDCLVKYSTRQIEIFTLKDKHWKWRMAAAAIDLAERVNASARIPAYFMVTDMLDVGLFKSLLKTDYINIPIILYFHENQLTYPWNSEEHKQRDRQFAWRNYTSILVSDKIVFNSTFHREEVFKALPVFLTAFPDQLFAKQEKKLREKSSVISPGIDFKEFEGYARKSADKPCILWNHRWEHDKNPEQFFEMLYTLQAENIDFDLIVCGEQYKKVPAIFTEARMKLARNIVHWGYFCHRSEYVKALHRSTILPVTSNQEFFGLSVMEAAFAGVEPLLPRRLSYPDIYAEFDVFYKDEQDCYNLLKSHCRNPMNFELPISFERYKWETLIHTYESLWLNA